MLSMQRKKLTEMRMNFLMRHKYPAASDDLQIALFKHASERPLGAEDSDIVDQLIEQFDLNVGDVTPGIGKNENRATLEETRQWLNGICELRDLLENARPREIARLYDEASRPARDKRRLDQIDADKDDFFSEQAASEGIDPWLALPAWKVEEAVALTLGKNPTIVNRQTLGKNIKDSPFRKEFVRRVNVVKRAIAAGILVKPLRPEKFMAWARGQQAFDLDGSPLQRGANEGGLKKKDAIPEKRLHSAIENTLRKMVLGMAVKHYGLSLIPEENLGSEAWTRISDDLASVGIELHSDSVNTHFYESLEKARSRAGDSPDGKKFKKPW